MRRPENRNEMIALLADTPAWKSLCALAQERIDQSMASIVTTMIMDEKTIAKHNKELGVIEALEWIVKEPDRLRGNPTSTV